MKNYARENRLNRISLDIRLYDARYVRTGRRLLAWVASCKDDKKMRLFHAEMLLKQKKSPENRGTIS